MVTFYGIQVVVVPPHAWPPSKALVFRDGFLESAAAWGWYKNRNITKSKRLVENDKFGIWYLKNTKTK